MWSLFSLEDGQSLSIKKTRLAFSLGCSISGLIDSDVPNKRPSIIPDKFMASLENLRFLRKSERFLLWLFVALYVLALPYAIILFDYLRRLLTLPVVKVLPFALLGLISMGYLWFCRSRNRGYELARFVAPVALLLALVYLIESNPIKYIHVPEYVILTLLTYFAINRFSNISTIVAAVIYSCMLGVFDEIHHGIHPSRYFGWTDMVINSVGSVIGGLSLCIFSTVNPPQKACCSAAGIVGGPCSVPMLIGSLVVALVSVIVLFDVTQSEIFTSTYPVILVFFNCLSIVVCLVVAFVSFQDTDVELILFFPPLILAAIQGLIIFAFLQEIRFQ